MVKRRSIPKATQDEVLIQSARRCCLCFGLQNDLCETKGQIVHLDHNPANNDLDNLAWLCLNHHDQYDSRPSQSKGFTIGEVKRYREELYQAVRKTSTSPQGAYRVQITFPGDTASFTADRQRAIRDALGTILGISPDAIEINRVYPGSIVLDIDLPGEALSRLRLLLESNNAKLRLLGVERVVLEEVPDKTETWVHSGGRFIKEGMVQTDKCTDGKEHDWEDITQEMMDWETEYWLGNAIPDKVHYQSQGKARKYYRCRKCGDQYESET